MKLKVAALLTFVFAAACAEGNAATIFEESDVIAQSGERTRKGEDDQVAHPGSAKTRIDLAPFGQRLSRTTIAHVNVVPGNEDIPTQSWFTYSASLYHSGLSLRVGQPLEGENPDPSDFTLRARLDGRNWVSTRGEARVAVTGSHAAITLTDVVMEVEDGTRGPALEGPGTPRELRGPFNGMIDGELVRFRCRANTDLAVGSHLLADVDSGIVPCFQSSLPIDGGGI